MLLRDLTGCWDHARSGADRFLRTSDSELEMLERLVGEVPDLPLSKHSKPRRKGSNKGQYYINVTTPPRGKLG